MVPHPHAHKTTPRVIIKAAINPTIRNVGNESKARKAAMALTKPVMTRRDIGIPANSTRDNMRLDTNR
jgi:predicted short-subunit dehydrogenase-like oxidoreductase (DUF2520 family)